MNKLQKSKERIAKLEAELLTVYRERDEARRIAEEATEAGLAEDMFGPSEAVLPWQDYDETVKRLGGCPGCGMTSDGCMCDEDDEAT